mmetsp:Transcript_7230/g.20379  ORF Transcript_7230/g.20379 Transcript_7230/m.20379 type:complete len:232 (+) Transcript_7230:929-1624(+)
MPASATAAGGGGGGAGGATMPRNGETERARTSCPPASCHGSAGPCTEAAVIDRGGAGGDMDLMLCKAFRGALLIRTGEDCLTTVQRAAGAATAGAGARPRGEGPLALATSPPETMAHCCCPGDCDLRMQSTSRIGLWRLALAGSPRACSPICVRDIDPRSGEVTSWALASPPKAPWGALLSLVGEVAGEVARWMHWTSTATAPGGGSCASDACFRVTEVHTAACITFVGLP